MEQNIRIIEEAIQAEEIVLEETRRIEPFTATTEDLDETLHLSEAERQQWIWTFERLKAADIGLSFSEKAKVFCDASSPEEVEQFVQHRLGTQNIFALVA